MPPIHNTHIRDLNSKLILETIIHSGGVSRAALARETGLTKATVSAIVQELINAKLVTEIGSDDTSLGRKPILLSFQHKAGYVISIDIAPGITSALAADLSGEIQLYKQIQTPARHELIFQLCDFITSMQHSLNQETDYPYGLCGITLSIHGVTCRGEILFTPHYQLAGLPLVEELSKLFMVPVFLENEANLAVIGERAFLPGYYENLASFSISSGVGLGLYLNGKLFTGTRGFAGEFGHTIIAKDGRLCSCGNHGCVEQYLTHPENAADMQDYLEILLLSIHNIVHCYDPELIILNSPFLTEHSELYTSIAATCKERFPTLNLSLSTLGRRAALYGGIHQAVLSFLGIRNLSFCPILESPT